MPRYKYACSQCERTFEIEKSISLSARTEACPHCAKPGVRVFTAPGLSRQGSEVPYADAGHEPGAGCAGCSQAGECGLD